MAITIVHKSEDAAPRVNSRTALVLAGGAITGGAYKLGGMLALERFLGRRAINDFDIYVGISAGAFLAAPLAAGVPPLELFRAVAGRSDMITPFRPTHFYWPNTEDFVRKPLAFLRDTLAYAPGLARDALRALVYRRRTVLSDLRRTLEGDPDTRLLDALGPILSEIFSERPSPFNLSYLPGGVFDNSRIERYVRTNLERNGMPNRFRLLKIERGCDLYICATNLQTAHLDVFGPDEDDSVTISQAVQASTAIPGFFRPARLRGRDYIDGGVSRTASTSLAAAKGADLIIAYNPFRPYNPPELKPGESAKAIADEGLISVINQAIRTMLHSRLHIGIEKLRLDPSFKGDILLIEPPPSDQSFFRMNPVNFWGRIQALGYGYRSVKESLESQYPVVQRILRRHGFDPDLEALQAAFERLEGADEERDVIHTFQAGAASGEAPSRPRLEVVS